MNKNTLSEDGRAKRVRILKLAIEEGDHLRKRRQAVRRAGLGAVVGIFVVAVALMNLPRTKHGGPAETPEPIAARQNRSPNGDVDSFQIEVVSSESIDVNDYIVRTSSLPLSVVILDDDALLAELKDVDPSIGIVRAGGQIWLANGDRLFHE